MRGVPLRGRFKVDSGGALPHPIPIFCRDRVSDFVWAPQAESKKKMHPIERKD